MVEEQGISCRLIEFQRLESRHIPGSGTTTMKAGLQRIEATLTQLTPQTVATAEPTPTTEPTPQESCSFQIGVGVKPGRATPSMPSLLNTVVLPPATASAKPSVNQTVPLTHPLSPSVPALPDLPRHKIVHFSTHRHATNPNLAISLLKEMEAVVVRWQRELQQVSAQIHQLYSEGPIIDGWLESQPHPGAAESPTPLSHVEITRLLDSVQALLQTENPQVITLESPKAGYRLCRLDSDGQMVCRPCPAEQVPAVSLAIARYQKLRQLLARQQHLETRLKRLVQSLVDVHGDLQG